VSTTLDPHLSLVRPVAPQTPGHAYAIGHPIVGPLEPGEDWRWCYVDEAYV
jgi:hypothetical protein